MPHIIHLITSLEGGGTENFLYQMLAHTPADLTQEVVYLKKDGPLGDRIRELGIPVKRIANPISLFLYFRKKRPAAVHTLLFRAHQMGRLLGKAAGVRTVLSSQRAIDAWQKPWHRLLDAWTLRFCDAVSANSSAAVQLVKKRRGARQTPTIVVISNGIDPTRFKPWDRVTSRTYFRLPETAILAGTLMRLHPEKGGDYIPGFAQALLMRHPQLHLVIAGVGPLESELKRSTAGQPWSDRLHWMGWTDDTPRYLSALDFFWLLSREESFPQTLVEASAIGLPWIAPDVGGVHELLMEKSSLHFQVGQVSQAVQAANAVIQELSTFRKNAEQAAEEFRRRYDITETARQFDAFLRYNR